MGRLSNREVDAMIQAEYEEALGQEEPWALDAYEYRTLLKREKGEPNDA